MMNRSILFTGIAAVLLACGIALGGQVSPASAAAAPASSPATHVTVPGTLQLHPTAIDCRFVACASDEDCAITPGCSSNLCSNRVQGQGFGRCTVRPQ